MSRTRTSPSLAAPAHLASVTLIAALALWSMPALAETDQADALTEVVTVFGDACVETSPSFVDAQAALEAKGFSIYAFGEGEFEFGREAGDIYGQVSANPDYPGCTVMNEGLSEAGAADLAADLLIDTFGITLDPWEYEGKQAGWLMPLDEGALYIIVNDGGISAEYRPE